MYQVHSSHRVWHWAGPLNIYGFIKRTLALEEMRRVNAVILKKCRSAWQTKTDCTTTSTNGAADLKASKILPRKRSYSVYDASSIGSVKSNV